MVKRVAGYIREIPSAVPLKGIPVTIKSDLAPFGAIAPGGMANGSDNPVMTTLDTGYFEWNCELSPGPISVHATTPNGEKVRSGYELMQAGDIFLSDLPRLMQVFLDGVIFGSAGPGVTPFNVTRVGLDLTIGRGSAIIYGYVFETLTPRFLTIATNPSGPTTRVDSILLRQWIDGANIGMQEIVKRQGTVNNVAPGPNPDGNTEYREVEIARAALGQSSGTCTVTNVQPFIYPVVITQPPFDDEVLAWETSGGGHWDPRFQKESLAFGGAQTASDDPSTAQEETYVSAISVPFTLPGSTAARWTVHMWGGASWGIESAENDQHVVRRIELVGRDPYETPFLTTKLPTYSHYPLQDTHTGLLAGSHVMRVLYKASTDGPGGIYVHCRAPYLHCMAWRTA